MKKNRTFAFVLPRPMLEVAKTISYLQKKIIQAGDFAFFTESPVGLENLKDVIILTYFHRLYTFEYWRYMEENITNKRLYVIAELHELINSLTKDTGAVRRIQYLKQGRSPYFYLNAGLTYMSETFEPSEKLTIVMHIPADHLDGYRVVSSRVEEIFQKVIGEKNLQIIWLNNSTDMIDCDGNYHVIFQAPYVIAKNPSVYEFEKACEDSPNVIFSHMNHTWERIAKDLKTVM